MYIMFTDCMVVQHFLHHSVVHVGDDFIGHMTVDWLPV